tara:strand:+ start:248 stop:805 length:558 start_codon:yes stop_codon:yes gene_type:complete
MTAKRKSPGVKAKDLRKRFADQARTKRLKRRLAGLPDTPGSKIQVVPKPKLPKPKPPGYIHTVPNPKLPKDRKPPVMTPMTSKGGPITKDSKKRSLAGGPKPKKFNLGGEAQIGLGRATVRKSQLLAQRKRVDDMLERLYGNKIKPKKKPKNPTLKKRLDSIKPKKKPLKPSLKKRLADQAKRRR